MIFVGLEKDSGNMIGRIELKPVVSVICLSYNHKDIIEQCIKGVLSQETNFSYEFLIHDDASTDGTIEILQEYAAKFSVIKLFIQQENQYSKGEGFVGIPICLNKAQGKYIAFCEGDDYWIDKHKLQKQYDAFVHDDTISLVYTNFNVVDMNNNLLNIEKFNKYKERSTSGYLFYDLLLNYNHIMTLTTMIKKEFLVNLPSYYFDYGFFLNALRNGKALYLNDITANYRINPFSVTNTSSVSLVHDPFLIIYDQLKKIYNDKCTCRQIKDGNTKDYIIMLCCLRGLFYSKIKMKYLCILLRKPYLLLKIGVVFYKKK